MATFPVASVDSGSQPAASSSSVPAFSEIAGRLIDLKSLSRPPSFSGLDTHWSDFKFRFTCLAALMQVDDLMAQAVRAADDPQMPAMGSKLQAQSRLLYNILV